MIESVAPAELIIAGQSHAGDEIHQVTNPFDNSLVGVTFRARAETVMEAADSMAAGAKSMAQLKAYQRAEILSSIASGILMDRDRFARLIALEAGKPIGDARVEVERAILTMRTSAEEATRITGDVMPLDVMSASNDRIGITRRFPAGPVLAITPFNFPLNLVCHKLGPAIASGNSILIKAAPKTPLTALAVGRLALDSGLPSAAISVIVCDNENTQRLVESDRFNVLSFTGSDTIGWKLKGLAGKKKVVLELGGNAGVIIDEGADFELALQRVVAGGFGYAGQSCISVQRVLVHDSMYDDFSAQLAARVTSLKVGDPLEETTDVGPLINADALDRVDTWVKEAVSAGARILAGGHADGSCYQPTVLADVNPGAAVCVNEAFAPIVTLSRFSDFALAIEELNESRYGLQAGVFTPLLDHVMSAYERLEVGAVIVNDAPTFRVDPMPYGGVKDSGLGREGVRYAIEEFTESRLLVMRTGDAS